MLFLAIASVAVANADEGYFGLTVNVDGTAGIVAGDEILEVEGHVFPGSKADAIAPLMEKAVGQPLTLKLRRSSGVVYSVALVAIARSQIEKG
jgi:C-terminal processing protease CtpA/Prc